MGTAQPPLPLQLFLPPQPLSPLLQPPIPLQAFMPLQACFSAVAQPPLPLQLFLPAQPLSPVLQPPWPLQAFMPLQACLSAAGAELAQPDRTTAPPARPAAAAVTNFPNSRRLIGFCIIPPKSGSTGLRTTSAIGSLDPAKIPDDPLALQGFYRPVRRATAARISSGVAIGPLQAWAVQTYAVARSFIG